MEPDGCYEAIQSQAFHDCVEQTNARTRSVQRRAKASTAHPPMLLLSGGRAAPAVARLASAAASVGRSVGTKVSICECYKSFQARGGALDNSVAAHATAHGTGHGVFPTRALRCYSRRVVTVNLAQTGEGIYDCELIRWFAKEGDSVKDFQPLCEVQSDKASHLHPRQKQRSGALFLISCFKSIDILHHARRRRSR